MLMKILQKKRLFKETMSNHNEIEPTLWAAAFWSILVDGYSQSGTRYE